MRNTDRGWRLLGSLVTLIVCGPLALADSARAQLDVSGQWRTEFIDSFFGTAHEVILGLAQTGSAVVSSPPYSTGTFEPDTGALHLDGTVTCFDEFFNSGPVPISLDAIVAPDGATFEGGYFQAYQLGRSCIAAFGPVHGERVATSCGNGVVDPGEDCDAGPVGTDCCTMACRVRPAGSWCSGGSHLCATGACDGTGSCVQSPEPAGNFCRASSGACDVPEICDGTSLDCPPDAPPPTPGDEICEACSGAPLERSRMKLDLAIPNTWPWIGSLALRTHVVLPAGESLPDPSTTWKLIEVRDGAGRLVVQKYIPPGEFDATTGRGWQRSGQRWRYRRYVPSVGTIADMTLIPARRAGGGVDVMVRLPRVFLESDDPILPLHVELILDGVGPSVQCGETSFAASPAAGPECRVSADGTVFRCR